MIDLRSDTVPPSPAMRQAMSCAAVGDELFGEDPTTSELEEYAAHLLGMEAALFVPTGTMGNALAILSHRCASDRILLDVQSHIFRREMQSPGVLCQLKPTLFDTPDGCPEREFLAKWCSLGSRTSLICLETTHTWRSGLAISLDRLRMVANVANAFQTAIHLDGARLFNAAVALEVEPTDIAATVDSVVFSLCKALGAPAGAVLAGRRSFIETARDYRLVLGGTMRQTGMLAAAGLLALREGWQDLQRDHARARRMAEQLSRWAPLDVEPTLFTTNVVLFDPQPLRLTGGEFARRTAAEGLKVAVLAPNLVRLTIHRNLTDADVDRAVAILSSIVEDCLSRCTSADRTACRSHP